MTELHDEEIVASDSRPTKCDASCGQPAVPETFVRLIPGREFRPARYCLWCALQRKSKEPS